MSTCKHMLRFMLYIISACFILCKNWLARPSGKKEGNKKAFFHYPYYVFVDRFKLAQPLVSLVIPFTLFKQITFNTIIRKKNTPQMFSLIFLARGYHQRKWIFTRHYIKQPFHKFLLCFPPVLSFCKRLWHTILTATLPMLFAFIVNFKKKLSYVWCEFNCRAQDIP